MALLLKRPLYDSRSLQDLDPQVRNQVQTLISNLQTKHGYTFGPICTLRGPMVQAQLYAQSRTKEMCEADMLKAGLTEAVAPWLVSLVRKADKLANKPRGHATYALPGKSFHHYGWAADLAYYPRPGIIDWDFKPAWAAMRNEATLTGLRVLDFETAHVQANAPAKIPYTWAEIEKLLKP